MNDFFIPARRNRAAKQDSIFRFRPVREDDPATQIRYALTPAGESLLKEWESARSTRLGGAR
jgi:hypothetical protein